MKIYTNGIDQITVNQIKNEGFDVIVQKVLPTEGELANDIFLFSTDQDDFPVLLASLREAHPKAELIYWHQKKGVRGYQSIHLLCKENGIHFIPPRSTTESIVNKIKIITDEDSDQKNNIIGVFGTGAGIGTTSITKLLAKSLAAAGQKVIMLGLNLYEPGYDQKTTISLDQLRPRITGKILQESDFDFIKQNGYSYLPGNYDYLSAQDYQEDEIEYLLEESSKHADVVICDFGSIPESAAWYVGMQKSAIRLIVTHPKHNYRLPAILELANQMELYPHDFQLVINRSTSAAAVSSKSLSQTVGCSIIFEIPQLEGFLDNLTPPKKDSIIIDEKAKQLLNVLDIVEASPKKGWGR